MVRNSSSVDRGMWGRKRVFRSQSLPRGLGSRPCLFQASRRALATTPTCQVTELGDPILSCATVQGLDLLRSHLILLAKTDMRSTGF